MTPDLARAAALVAHGKITKADACDGKVQHPSRSEAIHAAKVAGRRLDRAMTVYKCPFGPHWHLTKVPYGEEEAA